VTKKAFPIEHTFFSLRLFVLYQPRQVLDYLRQITQPVSGSPPTVTVPPPAGSDAWTREITARTSFGLFVLHRSKLNVSDLVRKIAQEVDRDGLVRPTEDELRRDRGYLFPASIQVMIGLILESPQFRDRIEDDPWYMQQAINALYMISRAWESGKDRVTIDRKAIADTLLARLDHEPVEGQEAAEKALEQLGVGRRELDMFGDAVSQLAEALCYPDRRELFLGDRFKPEENYQHDIFPPEMLLAPGDSGPEYRFLFDIYGQEFATRRALAEARTVAAVGGLPEPVATEIRATVTFSHDFDLALGTAGIDIAELVALRILPPMADSVELTGARNRLEEALSSGNPYPELAKDLPTLASLRNWVQQNGRAIAILFRLAQQVAHDAGTSPPPSLATVLRAVERYFDIASMFSPTARATNDQIKAALSVVDVLPFEIEDVTVVPGGDAGNVRAWEEELKRRREPIATPLSALARSAWPRWLTSTHAYLIGGHPVAMRLAYADVVCAAADLHPGNLFRRDLSKMSITEWSELCLSAFPGAVSEQPEPVWPFAVGLRALGFGRAVVLEAWSILPGLRGDDPDTSLVDDLTKSTPDNPLPGFVLVMREGGMSIAATREYRPVRVGQRPGTPVLALPERSLQMYSRVLEWLSSQGAITSSSIPWN
jgi:hypothetical protein